ncbi:unnamed protein product, partial [Cladocopium goreaui]
DENALQLTPHELMMYNDPRFGHDVRQLELHHIAATLLHSYSNALDACPCGCRQKGFHPLTLQKGGLRGFYVISKTTGRPRYLHPQEAGHLLGLPNSVHYNQSVRASLALLGLTASPLQAIWVFGHLKKNNWLATQKQPCPRVEDWLGAYCQELMAQTNNSLGLSISPPMSLDLMAFGETLEVRTLPVHIQASQLLQAERISLDWNEGGELWQDGHHLRLHDALNPSSSTGLELLCYHGPAERNKPVQEIVIAIQHEEVLQIHQVPPGRFLFELLTDMGLPLVRKVINAEGKLLQVDFRLWQPMALWTVTEAPWHQPSGSFRRANGSESPEQLGLHDGQIWSGIHSILRRPEGMRETHLIIHPATADALLHDWISPAHILQMQDDFHRSSGNILCVFEAHRHWTFLWGQKLDHYIHWTHFDGLFGFVSTEAQLLASNISGHLGLDFHPPKHRCDIPQLDPHTCGTVALAHLHQLLNPGLMVLSTDILFIHTWILHHRGPSGSIYATGLTTLSPEQMTKLTGLLAEHGVPENKLMERAQFVIQKLGAPAIIAAFVAKNCGDPWMDATCDPWNSWQPTTGQSTTKPASGKSHLAEMTGQLRDELQESMRKELDQYKQQHDDRMGEQTTAATEARFLQIETTMGEIQAQQQQFNQWFTQVGQATSATETAIQTINYTLSTHQQELQGLHQEVKTVSENLGNTIQKTLVNHQSEMTADFSARFDKLEAMFAKRPSDVLTIGTTNPGGLRNKEWLAVDQGCGIWTYSETQLSRVTQFSTAKALKYYAQQVGRHLQVHFGAPAPLRARSTWAGSWTGVACTSDFSSKRLQVPWPDDFWEPGRVLATQHYVGHHIVTLVSIYGLPRGPTWPKATAITTDIMDFISKEFVIGSSGIVLIAGDFNFSPHELTSFDTWRAYGFCSAQEMAAQRWNHEIVPTCKGTTERDMIWMSPMAASLCNNLHVQDVFHDHSSLAVELNIGVLKPSIRTWPRPREIPWDQVQIADWHQQSHETQPLEHSSSTETLKQLARTFEQSLNGFVRDLPSRSLSSAHCGRAQRLAPAKLTPTPQSCRASRPGEEHLVADTVNKAVILWFKQLRRIQSYRHSIVAGHQHQNAVQYRIELWSAIRRSRGFEGSFDVWWLQQDFAQVLGPLPLLPPDAQAADLIFQAFHHAFRTFERWNLQQRQQVLQARYDKTMKALFHDLRKARPDQVDSFWDTMVFEVIATKSATNGILLNKQAFSPSGSPWSRWMGQIGSSQHAKSTDAEDALYSLSSGKWQPAMATTAPGRQMLHQLEPYIHADAHGFLPTREPAQTWLHVQAAVETSIQSSLPLAGIGTDFVKAFNCIRREPLWALAKAIGIPETLLHPWSTYVAKFTRRFQVCNQVGDAHLSTQGFAEGCPLSVLAMALVDWGFQIYQHHYAPQVRHFSFVDNISMLAREARLVAWAFFTLRAFLTMWGLSIDVDKTYAWGTTRELRNQLGHLGINVVQDASELGGSLSFTAAHRVRIFIRRGDSLQEKWLQLRRSRAPLAQLLTDAWFQHVATRVHHKTMAGLEGLDVELTKLDHDKQTPLTLSRVRALQSGAFVSSWQHAKFDKTKQPVCQVCLTPDTQTHWLTCPRFDTQRHECGDLLAWIDSAPPCVTLHLLAPRSPFVQPLKTYFLGLEDACCTFNSAPRWGETNHVFTDGSFFKGIVSTLDRAAWAVVNATTGRSISHGPVPGLLQTIGRAELWGILSAIEWAITYDAEIILWTDSAGTWRKARRLQQHDGELFFDGENDDLWRKLTEALMRTREGQIDFRWTPSHIDTIKCDNAIEEFLAVWNDIVDRHAIQANRQRGDQAQQLLNEAEEYYKLWKDRLHHLRTFYTLVADARQEPLEVIDLIAEPANLAQQVAGITLGDALPVNWQLILAYSQESLKTELAAAAPRSAVH